MVLLLKIFRDWSYGVNELYGLFAFHSKATKSKRQGSKLPISNS